MEDLLQALNRLQELARSWGGSIALVEELPVPCAPFTSCMGVDYDKKEIYVEIDRLNRSHRAWEMLGGVIHEMGHVFACDQRPESSEEYDFLGWEWLVARQTGLLEQWEHSMSNYSIGNDEFSADFDCLSPDQASDLIEERVARARELGLITDDESPRAIR